MLLIGLMENRSKKGQFIFDSAIAVIILLFILYFGLTTIAELHKVNENTLEEQILFNKLITVADHIVKVEVETRETLFGSKAIYHHKLTTQTFNNINANELREKLQLKELNIGISNEDEIKGHMCINRIVLYNNEISILRVCGK